MPDNDKASTGTPAKCPACFATSNEQAEKDCIPVEDSCPIVQAGFFNNAWPTQEQFDAVSAPAASEPGSFTPQMLAKLKRREAEMEEEAKASEPGSAEQEYDFEFSLAALTEHVLATKAEAEVLRSQLEESKRENERMKSARVELKLGMAEACRVVAELREKLAEREAIIQRLQGLLGAAGSAVMGN